MSGAKRTVPSRSAKKVPAGKKEPVRSAAGAKVSGKRRSGDALVGGSRRVVKARSAGGAAAGVSREQLENIGFVWKVRGATDDSITFDQIYDALSVYRAEIKQSGPLTVPKEFCVPDAEPWPG